MGQSIGTGQQVVNPNDPLITKNKVVNIQDPAVQRWMRQDPSTWPEIVGHRKEDGSIEFGDGNHRLEAARRLGIQELPITVLGEGDRALPATPKAREGLGNAIGEIQRAMNAVDEDVMSSEMQTHFFGKAEEGLTYGAAKNRLAGEPPAARPAPEPGGDAPRAAEPEAPAPMIDRARGLFEESEHVSPAKIKAELGVTMKEAIELAGQLKKERRPQRNVEGAKPLKTDYPEVPREKVMAQVSKDHGKTSDAVRAMVDSEGGKFVEVDVPMDKIDLENIAAEAKAGNSGINPGKVRRYAAEKGDAPPIVGVSSPTAKGKLFVADGRHRVLSQALRDKESGKSGTVKAHVPEKWARENLGETAAKAELPEGVTHRGPQKNRAGEVVYDTYQDSVAGTSFSVKPGESIEMRMNEARARMKKAPERPVADAAPPSPGKAKAVVRQQMKDASSPVSPQGIINKRHAELGLGRQRVNSRPARYLNCVFLDQCAWRIQW